MNRFSLIGRCYMKESLIDCTSSNNKELDRIYGLFPHRNGPVCDPDDIYDLDQLTVEFVLKKNLQTRAELQNRNRGTRNLRRIVS